MPCSTAVKLPPTTTWPSVGLLCLCSCSLPVYFGANEEDSSTGTQVASETSDVADVTDAPTEASSGAGAVTVDPSGVDSSSGGDGPRFDLGVEAGDAVCGAPASDCDALDEDLAHALGLDCEGGGVMAIDGSLAVSGAPGSSRVVGALGASFGPRLGSRAVLLSTGDASHALLAPAQLEAQTDCSQIGLPCPSTEFPPTFDLEQLPPPIEVTAISCPPGQAPESPGDCSQTVDSQWGGEPRRAHDYAELRFSAEVPPDVAGIALQAAFFTAEYPPRFPTGYNDLALIWLESEQWTGNFALHPTLQLPLAAETLKEGFDHTSNAPELAGFAFAEHAGMDWMTLRAGVVPGETVTLVAAIFDVGDGQVDSALLLDDLRWDCIAPTLGQR